MDGECAKEPHSPKAHSKVRTWCGELADSGYPDTVLIGKVASTLSSQFHSAYLKDNFPPAIQPSIKTAPQRSPTLNVDFSHREPACNPPDVQDDWLALTVKEKREKKMKGGTWKITWRWTLGAYAWVCLLVLAQCCSCLLLLWISNTREKDKVDR